MKVTKTSLDDICKTLQLLPEIQAGKGMWQNEYHAFDVYNHTLECVKNVMLLTDDTNMIAAAYLHDIGKPVVAKPKYKDGALQEKEPGKQYYKFTNHEMVGEKMVREMSSELFHEFGLDQERIASLVGCHYIPPKGIKAIRKSTNYPDFSKACDELQAALDNAGVSRIDIFTIFMADRLARGNKCTDLAEALCIAHPLFGSAESRRDLYIFQMSKYKNKELPENWRTLAT